MKFILTENSESVLPYEVDLESALDIVSKLLNISQEDIKSVLPEVTLESVYNYAFDNNIRINDITYQQYKDLEDENLYLVHGSRSGIRGNIRLDVSSDSNDFGTGFYCGTELNQAGMFVCDEPKSSLYIIQFNSKGLKRCKFTVDTDWMLAVAYYRDTLGELENNQKVKDIIRRVRQCDYVVAPIADNRMFETIDAFVSGNITDKQCLYALSTTNLGAQYVFKKNKCLDKLDIVSHLYLCQAEKDTYRRKSEIETNTSLNKAILSKEKFAGRGQYIDELLKGAEDEI